MDLLPHLIKLQCYIGKLLKTHVPTSTNYVDRYLHICLNMYVLHSSFRSEYQDDDVFIRRTGIYSDQIDCKNGTITDSGQKIKVFKSKSLSN